jgi:prepilin-type N-terminal cleavage/methylation domain-containing protein
MQAQYKTRFTDRGFTLIETLIVLSILAMLLEVSSSLFVAGLHAWYAGCTRTGVREDVSYAMEKVVRDLKEIANGSLSQYSSIAHTIQYYDLSGNTYILYLYNADDTSLDSTYSESLYDLRKATRAQLDGGNYDAGVLILRDLVSPDATAPATALTISGTQVTLDFVVQRGSETVRLKTKIRPRNL